MSKKGNLRIRLSMDPKERFPEKLYDVASDGYLVSWNGCGDGVVVNEEKFEENVMKCYPGFVQISSFANFRRLFREYGFDWEIVERYEKHSYTFEFSHPSFKHGKRNLLCKIQTRRKSFSKPSHVVSTFNKDVAEISALSRKENEGRLTRTRVGRTKRVNYADVERNRPKRRHSSSPLRQDIVTTPSESDVSNITPSEELTEEETVLLSNIILEQHRKLEFDLRAQDIMRTFVKNEFSFDEFCVWVERNQHVFFNPSINNNESSSECNDHVPGCFSPCGHCACCKSMGL